MMPIFSLNGQEHRNSSVGSILWMRALKSSDDRHILICSSNAVNTRSDSLKRFDRRIMRRPVICYSNHRTTHRRANLPDVDCSERVMYGCDVNGILRGWDIDTGTLLSQSKIKVESHTISEYAPTKSKISCFCCSEPTCSSSNVMILLESTDLEFRDPVLCFSSSLFPQGKSDGMDIG
mmetsp:Transcript_14109/g.16382  ORF Transcript_14109/g.16382 Transcript_14109/m.16382 type:complete len:178 (-) Transcript_14109:565-1098(-)